MDTTVEYPYAECVTMAETAKDLIKDINVAREAQGLYPVKIRYDLMCAAQKGADEQYARQVCDHNRYKERAQECGARVFGEVAACNFQTVQSAVQGLLASPPHYAIMMDPRLARVGVGVAGSVYKYFVYVFDRSENVP